MLELILCSLVTILPDFLYRRFGQDKRIGREITLYSVWFELRWGITACVMLTVLLITIIFYYHPATNYVSAFFRTVPILPETNGRVSEIYVKLSDEVKQGQPIFKLDSTKQEAALEVARRRIAEIDATTLMARADIDATEAQIQHARNVLKQAADELRTKQELFRRNPGVVAPREIERLQTSVDGRNAEVSAATAAKHAAETRVNTVLPAERASAEAQLSQAQVELDKMVVYAGVSGRIEQFVLRVGDIVNPFMRPAGILIPEGAGRQGLQAGFGQIEAQVMKVGMAAEATCVSKPLQIIPLVVVAVQDVIATGQVRAGEQLIDVQQSARPGSITVFLAPLYEGGLDGVTPGSSCIANAYSSNHQRIAAGDVGTVEKVWLHVIDAVAVVHAMILRVQAVVLPVKTLVLTGH